MERKVAVLHLYHQRFGQLFLLNPYKGLIFNKIFDLFYSFKVEQICLEEWERRNLEKIGLNLLSIF